MKLSIQINRQYRKCVKQSQLRQAVAHTCTIARPDTAVELSLVITNQETIQQLNLEYRGIDHPTDVLAFSLTEQPDKDDPFITPPDGLNHLGEVVISYPQAIEQATEHGHIVEQELTILAVHGVLHLLGYDHDTSSSENKMRCLEERILNEIHGCRSTHKGNMKSVPRQAKSSE